MKFNFDWKLSDLPSLPPNSPTVFSTFSCGGGSSMGYMLAGYSIVAANDIDATMGRRYLTNILNKKYFLKPIRNLLTEMLPSDLYNLDILDGSPPCSTFSTAGAREKGFGVNKKFTEGQSKQVLSDLFFDFLDLANKLRPKVIVAENVTGILKGNSRAYANLILKRFDEIGYNCQLFQLNAASMGVPQKRERVFFIAGRKDLNYPKIELKFNEKPILFKDIEERGAKRKALLPSHKRISKLPLDQSGCFRVNKKGSTNFFKICPKNKVPLTITAKPHSIGHYDLEGYLTTSELIKIGTFPSDYIFGDVKPQYLIGMSVPPVMMAQVAYQIKKQWLKL